MIAGDSERMRQRLRRLVSSRENEAEKSEILLRKLRLQISEANTALARLKIYSGPQSAELFRLSFMPAKVQAHSENIAGVMCIQLRTADMGGNGLLPRFTSLLTSPQDESASRQAKTMVKSLWAYVNSVLAVRGMDRVIRRLRHQLRRAEENVQQERQKNLAYRAAQMRNFENTRYYWRLRRNENSGYGARQAP